MHDNKQIYIWLWHFKHIYEPVKIVYYYMYMCIDIMQSEHVYEKCWFYIYVCTLLL